MRVSCAKLRPSSSALFKESAQIAIFRPPMPVSESEVESSFAFELLLQEDPSPGALIRNIGVCTRGPPYTI